LRNPVLNLPVSAETILLGCPVRRALVIRWGALGDLVLATAVFEDLSQNLPDVEIHLNTEPPWDRMFQNDPRFKSVYVSNVRDKNRNFNKMIRWISAIRGQNYDLIIDLQSNDRSRLLLSLLALSGHRPVLIAGTKRGFPYNVVPTNIAPQAHALDYFRAPLIGLGLSLKNSAPVLRIGQQQRAETLMIDNDLQKGKFAIFVPGSSLRGVSKRWGVNNFILLAAKLRELGIVQLALVGGDVDQEVCDQITKACGNQVKNLCGQTEIRDLYYLAGAARFIVGNDTGVIHVAAASGSPTVVLFGPSDARLSSPLGKQVKILIGDPEAGKKNISSDPSCINNITPENVISALMLFKH